MTTRGTVTRFRFLLFVGAIISSWFVFSSVYSDMDRELALISVAMFSLAAGLMYGVAIARSSRVLALLAVVASWGPFALMLFMSFSSRFDQAIPSSLWSAAGISVIASLIGGFVGHTAGRRFMRPTD